MEGFQKATAYITKTILPRKRCDTKSIPGPRGPIASIRGAFHMQHDLLSFLCSIQSSYSNEAMDPVSCKIMGRQIYLLVHPVHITRMLRDNESFRRPLAHIDVFRKTLGYSAVTVPDEEWKPVRRRTMGYFEVSKLHSYGEVVADVLKRRAIPAIAEKARAGEAFDIFDQMLDIASIAAFVNFIGDGVDETPKQIYRALNRIFCYIRKHVFTLVLPPLWVPTHDNRELKKDMSLLRDYLKPKLQDKAIEQTMMGDIARSHKLPDGSPNVTRILEETTSNLVGASETTIILMAWTLYYIIQNPDVQARLLAEMADVLEGRTPTTHDFKSMPYLDAVVNETLRLRPPAYATARSVINDTLLAGFMLRRGGLSFASQYITHRHPRLWKDPDAFNPARFDPTSPEAPQNRRSETVFFPFADGQHACPGRHYAVYEAKLMVLLLLRHFHFRATDPNLFNDVGMDARVTLRPAKPILVTARIRA